MKPKQNTNRPGHAGLIASMRLPGAASTDTLVRFKLVTGSQGGYFGGKHAPNATPAARPAPTQNTFFSVSVCAARTLNNATNRPMPGRSSRTLRWQHSRAFFGPRQEERG